MPVMSQLVTPRMCYIQKETTNQSFLDMHYYLKSMGIQNNDFFLALLDPGLAGVDPRDPNLSTSMKARIMNECRNNYWYFLREVTRIPDQGGQVNSGKRYQLNRANLAINFLFSLNFNIFGIIPRQHGKTICAVCRYLWVYNFGTTNSEIMFLHKDHSGSKGNLKRLKEIRDALPSYLQMSSATGIDGKPLKVPNTVVMIEHPYNHNKISTFPSARTKAAADNLGRGMTMPLQYYDEFAFIPYNRVVYNAATPAYSTASQNAKSHGAPYGILLTSTPGDMTTESGSYAYDIRNNGTKWNDRYYDFTVQQLYELKDSNTNSPFWIVEFTYQQLGSGQDYFKRMVIDMLRDWPAIRREVMLEWAQIAENCAFNQEDLDIISSKLKEPIRTLFFGRFRQYQFNVYEDIDFLYPPIIGVDVAGGTYQDSSAITIIDSRTTRVCATFNCNFIPTDDLADLIYELVTKYMPNAVVNIERNGVGHGVVSRLVKTSIKSNLYWEVKDKVIEEAFNGVRMEKNKRRVRVYGLDSTKDVRQRLIELLYERVQYHKDKFVSKVIFDEMQSMQVKKSGKVEHSDQTHDDQVFSYLLALYVWYDGQDLAQNWRISKNTIQTDEDIEFEENILDTNTTPHEEIQLETIAADEDDINGIAETLEWAKANSRLITSDTLQESYSSEIDELRSKILTSNESARINYAKETGLDPSMYINNDIGMKSIQLPTTLFDMDYDDGYDEDDFNTPSPLAGNLKDMWRNI